MLILKLGLGFVAYFFLAGLVVTVRERLTGKKPTLLSYAFWPLVLFGHLAKQLAMLIFYLLLELPEKIGNYIGDKLAKKNTSKPGNG